jgi:hypothetical protein
VRSPGHCGSKQDQADVAVGLATVSRLLAIELAAATGSTEPAVFERLDALVHRLQHPSSAGSPRRGGQRD